MAASLWAKDHQGQVKGCMTNNLVICIGQGASLNTPVLYLEVENIHWEIHNGVVSKNIHFTYFIIQCNV